MRPPSCRGASGRFSGAASFAIALAMSACGTAASTAAQRVAPAERSAGQNLVVVPDHGVGQIRLGELRSKVAQAYGPGMAGLNPPSATYRIAKQAVTVQFDHERAIKIFSSSPDLTLFGQRLSKGWGFWKPRLRALGWPDLCSTTVATSPHRHTELVIEAHEIYAEVATFRYDVCGIQVALADSER